MPMSDDFKWRLFPLIPKIAEKFGTPFQIDDELGIRETLARLNKSFTSLGIDFKEFYAVKANPIQAIMDVVYDCEGGYDCSSIPELRLARAAGAKPEDIMFTSNNTSQEEFLEALDHGGCILNLDDEIFIDKVPGPFPELICFRLNPGNRKTGDEVNSIIGDPVNSKYGVPIERIIDVYKRAREKGAKRFGLHVMVCSNDRNYLNMVRTVELLLEVAKELYRAGIKLEFINMGGGIGIPYRPGDEPFYVDALAVACWDRLTGFAYINDFKPKLFLESGRYVTGPHGVLVNRVINVYGKYKDYVGVEVAMPALMRVGMYGAYHHCTVLDKNGVEKTGPTKKVSIVGSICENCDRLANEIELPLIEEDDYIITHDTGAHGLAMGFNYNGRTRPQALMLCQNKAVKKTLRGESYEDILSRQIVVSEDGPITCMG